MANMTTLPAEVIQSISEAILDEFPSREIVQVADNIIRHENARTRKRDLRITGSSSDYAVSLKADANRVRWCLRGHQYNYPTEEERDTFNDW